MPHKAPKTSTMPEKFEIAALSLPLGLLSKLISQENRAFGKRSSFWKNFETRSLRFGVDKKQFENGAFRKRHPDNHMVLLNLIVMIVPS